MALAEAALSLIFVFLVPPFAMILIFVLITASVGKSIGLREKYVKGLIQIFEFCKTRLAAQRKLSEHEPCDSETESSEDERLISEEDQTSSSNEVITREIVLRPGSNQFQRSFSTKEDFKLWDPLYYLRTGIEAIVDDEVTKRFSAEELTSWNLLTRTNSRHQFVSVRLTAIWVLGFMVRYFILLPIRVAILFVGTIYLVLGCAVIGQMPDGRIKRWLANCMFLSMFRIMARGFSNVVYYHNTHNRPRSDGICVANHTSPIDCIVLAQDGCFSFVGQRHGGFLGLLQTALSRASSHIWFERSEAKDRYAVAKRLREHVEDPNKLPILIFPEGTCINNTSVMQFKKGTFEVGGTIYPVAIKYDPRFGDAFWNSSEYGMMSYILMMMTSWAIVCDVWYLPPMTIREGETSIDFANRVKAEIARQGGLVDLIWDGGLKRSAVKKEWREQYQQEFSRRLRLHSLSSSAARKARLSTPSALKNNNNNDTSSASSQHPTVGTSSTDNERETPVNESTTNVAPSASCPTVNRADPLDKGKDALANNAPVSANRKNVPTTSNDLTIQDRNLSVNGVNSTNSEDGYTLNDTSELKNRQKRANDTVPSLNGGGSRVSGLIVNGSSDPQVNGSGLQVNGSGFFTSNPTVVSKKDLRLVHDKDHLVPGPVTASILREKAE